MAPATLYRYEGASGRQAFSRWQRIRLTGPVTDRRPGDIRVAAQDRPDEIAQVTGYAEDLKRRYPKLTVRRHVAYTVAGSGFRFFTLG